MACVPDAKPYCPMGCHAEKSPLCDKGFGTKSRCIMHVPQTLIEAGFSEYIFSTQSGQKSHKGLVLQRSEFSTTSRAVRRQIDRLFVDFPSQCPEVPTPAPLTDAKLINNCRSARPLRVSAFKTSTPSSGCLYPLGLGPDFPLEPPLGSPRVPTRCAEYLGSRSSGSQIGRPAPPGPLNLTESAAPDWLEGWFVVIGSSSPVSARYHFWGLGTGLSALSGMM